ncbi:hypothetical protein CDAR_593321 [Caerostris darwini]|uniref:Uncharacterized protein n=1 Tax=Caerostris darwini TaxID=1538125 RepID=A0AAV4VV65_9ARAC|nr:hypothetical protein CDAR_593321 [Caerostris darwini]
MLASHRGKDCGLVHKSGVLESLVLHHLRIKCFIRCEREIRTSPSPKGKYGFGAAITGAFAGKEREVACFQNGIVLFGKSFQNLLFIRDLIVLRFS